MTLDIHHNAVKEDDQEQPHLLILSLFFPFPQGSKNFPCIAGLIKFLYHMAVNFLKDG